ncbi:FadR family transcriptional regulator [Candidatus Sumerlaeota bacterium]|nr:FadR family transcriptional regulator [Candidatus Sumerlaeota bacterium]
MRFQAVDKTNLVEKVEKRLLDVIRKNHLSIGDGLPSEIELTQKLGVSRSVVREALSRLRMLGVLETRKKRGMIVAEPDVFSSCGRALDTALLNKSAQEDLFEMRLILELGFADLLFLRKTDADLEFLEKIVEKEEKTKSEPARIKLEIKFHKTLYQIAGNDMLLRFQCLLNSFFREAVQREKKNKRYKGNATHRDLLEELQNGTPDGFREKMRSHLSPHLIRLKERSKGD